MEIGQTLFEEVAEQKAAIGDAIVSYDMTGKIYSVKTTAQLENKVNLKLEEDASYTVAKLLFPQNCN